MQKYYNLAKFFGIICILVFFIAEYNSCYKISEYPISIGTSSINGNKKVIGEKAKNEERLSRVSDNKIDVSKSVNDMQLLLALSDPNSNFSTYLIKNKNSKFIIQKVVGLHSKFGSEYITLYPNSQDLFVYDYNSNLQNPTYNTITTFLPVLERHPIQTKEREEIVAEQNKNYPLSGSMQITYMHNNTLSWNQCFLALDMFYGCPTILSFSSGLTEILIDKLSKVCNYSEKNGFTDCDKNELIIYDNIYANSLKNFSIEEIPDNVLTEKNFSSYQYYQKYYQNFPFTKINFDIYNGNSQTIVRYSIFPDYAVEPEFIKIAVKHEKGKWISYACVDRAMNFADLCPDDNNTEFIDAVDYPYMVKLSDEITDELIDNFTIPVKSFDEIQALLPGADDFFTNTEEDMMGIICNDTLFMYSSSSEIEPLEKIKVGENSRIVMLEWLTEAEYKDWEEYFKTKEEVQ